MQIKSNHIKLNKRSSIKAVLGYCWMVILSLSFCSQQFSSFVAHSGPLKESPAVVQGLHLSTAPQLSAPLPIESAPASLDIEMEVAEEDETKNHTDDYYRHPLRDHLSEELQYSSSLLSRFLQLATSIHNRSTVPCFVLHHSWKSELS